MSCTPAFITFTGADDGIPDIEYPAMDELSQLYPIEWGVLFSPARTGLARYPTAPWVTAFMAFAKEKHLHLAAHVCGAYSRELLETGTIRVLAPVLAEGAFQRIQVNTADRKVHERLPEIRAWADNFGCEVIVQTRDPERFPEPGLAQWLYDTSGGRGELPARWPANPASPTNLVGFAGGLQPENVMRALPGIQSGVIGRRYWIDMETGVRDENDLFDLRRCRDVCQAVYGECGR